MSSTDTVLEFPRQPQGAAVSVRLDRPMAGARMVVFGEPPIPAVERGGIDAAGYQRGRAEADAAHAAQVAEMRQEVVRVRDQVLGEMGRLYQDQHRRLETAMEDLEERLPELAMLLVRKVLGGYAPEAEALQAIVRDLLEDVSAAHEKVEVRLHPEALALLQRLGDDSPLERSHVTVGEDDSLGLMDCVVRHPYGEVDGRLETKLRRLEEEVRGS